MQSHDSACTPDCPTTTETELTPDRRAAQIEVLRTISTEQWLVAVAVAFRIIGRREAAEDVVQDSHLAVWERVVRGNNRIENVQAYFFTTVRHRALTEVSKRSKHSIEQLWLADIKRRARNLSLEQTRQSLSDLLGYFQLHHVRHAQTLEALLVSGGKKSEAAELLGVTQVTLRRRFLEMLAYVKANLEAIVLWVRDEFDDDGTAGPPAWRLPTDPGSSPNSRIPTQFSDQVHGRDDFEEVASRRQDSDNQTARALVLLAGLERLWQDDHQALDGIADWCGESYVSTCWLEMEIELACQDIAAVAQRLTQQDIKKTIWSAVTETITARDLLQQNAFERVLDFGISRCADRTTELPVVLLDLAGILKKADNSYFLSNELRIIFTSGSDREFFCWLGNDAQASGHNANSELLKPAQLELTCFSVSKAWLDTWIDTEMGSRRIQERHKVDLVDAAGRDSRFARYARLLFTQLVDGFGHESEKPGGHPPDLTKRDLFLWASQVSKARTTNEKKLNLLAALYRLLPEEFEAAIGTRSVSNSIRSDLVKDRDSFMNSTEDLNRADDSQPKLESNDDGHM